ncbi:MAG: class I SAM-dependent methyltransferase [Bifidobacteriaceae bacterium]|jgi:SAM-dependent methyltransferase|nr:class I SAM-dependent methyltransferase [Bifidobacteriaceae bacterium]
MSEYIHGHGPAAARAHALRNAVNSAGHLVGLLEPGLRVLDLGSASGALTKDLAARVAPGEVLGVDVSPDAVRQAQDDPDRPANLNYETGDVYSLRFADQSFDVVHVHQVLHHLTDPVAAIMALARLVRPGGYLALREGDYGSVFWYPEAAAWRSWQETYQLVARGGGTEVDAGRRLVHWLNEAGLADKASISGSVWTFPGYEPVRDMAASWADRLTERHFVGLAEELGVSDETSLVRTAAGLIEWANRPDAFLAMPHIEAIVRL